MSLILHSLRQSLPYIFTLSSQHKASMIEKAHQVRKFMLRLKLLLIMFCVLLTACAEEAADTLEDSIDPVQQLSAWCYADWHQKDWKMGESQVLAKDNEAFSEGIRKVCRARAELYAEGYEIYPFIADD
ncbi:MAG TPA: hypothetical protein VK999_03185, partial [Methylotenera sp.]|nr:hypothetical protein [Methylotenera sp.]